MIPQKEPVADPMQPRLIDNPTTRYSTEDVTGLDPLRIRYDISSSWGEGQPIVSWKQKEFEGGPDIYVEEPGGKKKLAGEGDSKEKAFTASDTGESEQASSVILVNDLGFEAAPAVSLHQFRSFYSCWAKNQSNSETEHFMAVDELRGYLGYNGAEAYTIEQLIGKEMEISFEKSKKDNKDYLTIDAFEAIFNIETIKSLVKETHPKNTKSMWQKMVAQIVGIRPNEGYRRILGVLVLMDRASYIDGFIREGITDSDLPIRRGSHNDKEFVTHKGAHTLFKSWHRNDIELFYVYQGKVFIPFFDIQEDKLCSYQFSDDIRLPWKEYTEKRSGGNGLVHQVQIHPKHHNFKKTSNDSEKSLYFALKEIPAIDRDTYRRELWALQKSISQTQREKHLIKLLLTFEHGDKCYFLFEWADGNLADLWAQSKSNLTPAPSDTWAVQQCLGVSSAIKRIHGLATWQKERRLSLGSGSDDERGWGRHGDIKPNNILWFSEYGNDPSLPHHLVVSDLGLTRYHSRATRSAVHWLHIEGYTRAYRPPEMDMEHMISQKYDVWSLGCVFLEFCVWYVGDGKAVEVFGLNRASQDESEIENVEEDKYFNIRTDHQGRKIASLNPIVEEVRKHSFKLH
ncbi:kinase-like domain-containing protein [Hypoxylon cercidicola]|nr:kinase-like domain-containing protein [Hypoxylon cercidicola]